MSIAEHASNRSGNPLQAGKRVIVSRRWPKLDDERSWVVALEEMVESATTNVARHDGQG